MDHINGIKREAKKLCKDIGCVGDPVLYEVLIQKTGSVYREYIEEKGYDLTVEEVCDIFDVTENYVQRYMIKYIDRIEITKDARRGLKSLKAVCYYNGLSAKRILMSRNSFIEYLSSNLVKHSDRLTFIFQPDNFKDINNYDLKSLKKRIREIEDVINKMEGLKIFYEFDFSIPKFQSIENLKIRLGLRHNVQIYRIIEKYSYKKYTLNKYIVRYVVPDEDIERIIEDNKENIIHKTSNNIIFINTPTISKKESEIVFQVEKYALAKYLDIDNLGYQQIKDKLLEYLKEQLLKLEI